MKIFKGDGGERESGRKREREIWIQVGIVSETVDWKAEHAERATPQSGRRLKTSFAHLGVLGLEVIV